MIRIGSILILVLLCTLRSAFAQTDSTSSLHSDSLKSHLGEVFVYAYESNGDRRKVAAPVAVIEAKDLNQYNPQSAVQAVNSIPGVRMDERSPSSYRINIRGSSMRAPFGVRNVKVYYGDFPYTEPGGTSYINQLGLLNFADAEIVKGPGGSMYGAGTGGVLRLGNEQYKTSGFSTGYAFGSYNTHTFFGDVHAVVKNTTQHILYQQNISDGYREQSASNRRIFNWDARYRLGRHYELGHMLLFGDLYYQTPGALTLKEFLENPLAARPAAGNFPSAVKAQAAIWQKMLMSGLALKSDWDGGFSNRTSVYAAYTSLNNATIRNYSYLMQPHYGGRTVFNFIRSVREARLKLDAGAELQTGRSLIDVYDNNLGTPGDMQSISAINTLQWFVFLQASFAWHGWELQLGSSLNNISMNYSSDAPVAITNAKRSFSNIVSPRISLSKALYKNAFAYASVSKGFSPPVTDELLPSGSAFNATLQPEQGINYEAGFRYFRPEKILLELNAYYFRLDQTIVQRRDIGGGDYYVNAGNTTQPGIEFNVNWTAIHSDIADWQVKASYAYQPYRYGSFSREQNDYSNNALPGVTPHNMYLGTQLVLLKRIICNVNYFYNGRVPLNDLNSEYGGEVHALSGKLGYKFETGAYSLTLFAGVENTLNKVYSLGYDINAAGGRYYNAAPGRNYCVQLVLNR
jgi:iron complex outermembrane recepter protein